MPLAVALKHKVEAEVSRLSALARDVTAHSFPTPAVSFRRSGKNAGTAFLQQHRVNFHPVLLEENVQAYFDEVIAHEVAHLLTFRLHGKVKPHGPEWRAIMRDVFDTEPATTHQFDLSKLKLNTFSYQCLCGPVSLSVRRHNNIQRGQQYRCRRCDTLLTPA